MARWYSFVQFPRTAGRANDIVPSLDNVHWDVLNGINMVENMRLLKENGVDEVVAFNASKSNCEI